MALWKYDLGKNGTVIEHSWTIKEVAYRHPSVRWNIIRQMVCPQQSMYVLLDREWSGTGAMTAFTA